VLLRITILSCLIYRAFPLQALSKLLTTPTNLLSHRRSVYSTFSTQTYSIPKKSIQPMPVVSIFQPSDRFIPDTNELSIVSWNQLLPSSVDGWWLYKQYCPLTPQDKRTWAFRRELFEARLLNDDKPDVIALQEASERSHEVNAPCVQLLRLFNPLTEILTASQHTLHRLTTRTFPFTTNGRSPTEVACVA
jgi:hypothetical protein